jgi:hypothetical protein
VKLLPDVKVRRTMSCVELEAALGLPPRTVESIDCDPDNNITVKFSIPVTGIHQRAVGALLGSQPQSDPLLQKLDECEPSKLRNLTFEQLNNEIASLGAEIDAAQNLNEAKAVLKSLLVDDAKAWRVILWLLKREMNE